MTVCRCARACASPHAHMSAGVRWRMGPVRLLLELQPVLRVLGQQIPHLGQPAREEGEGGREREGE
eukprot:3757320-Rhodomonas_salina.1